MEKITNQQLQATGHIFDNLPWSVLSDDQKAKLLLGSERFLDVEIFLNEFTSLEEPNYNNGVEG